MAASAQPVTKKEAMQGDAIISNTAFLGFSFLQLKLSLLQKTAPICLRVAFSGISFLQSVFFFFAFFIAIKVLFLAKNCPYLPQSGFFRDFFFAIGVFLFCIFSALDFFAFFTNSQCGSLRVPALQICPPLRKLLSRLVTLFCFSRSLRALLNFSMSRWSISCREALPDSRR